MRAVRGLLATSARREAAQRPRAAARRPTPDYQTGLQAGPVHQRLVPDPRRATTSSWSTGAVERITAGGVVGPDGVERPADTIIWGTGFQSHDFVAPMEIRGPRRPRAERGLGRAPRGLPGDDRLRLPEHVRDVRAQHQPRLGLGAVHARVPVQLRARRDPAPARGRPALHRPAPEAQAELAARDRGAQPARRIWVTGGCTNWYMNGRASTPTTGPARGSSSGAAR